MSKVNNDIKVEARVEKIKFIDKSIMKISMKGNSEKLKILHEFSRKPMVLPRRIPKDTSNAKYSRTDLTETLNLPY